MIGRALGAVVVLLALGAAGGYAAGLMTHDEPTSFAEATPVPAESPAYPVRTVEPYAEDVDVPALADGLAYRRHELGSGGFTWSYRAPRGWVSTEIGAGEVTWKPPGNPVGGYGMRVKLVSERKTTQTMVTEKLAALESIYEDVTVLGRSGDTIAVTYRSESGLLRLNTFRWFARTVDAAAEFETSVNGRSTDATGLTDLLDQVSASVRPPS